MGHTGAGPGDVSLRPFPALKFTFCRAQCDMHTSELEIKPLTRPRSVRVVNMTMSDNF